MFSNYLQKIFSPNSPNHKDNEAKLQIYSSNTLRSKRVSTNQQKPNQQISLENDQNSNTLHTYEPLYSTKKKTGNECNTTSYSTNTFTATKPSHRYEYGNVGELNNNHINSNNYEVNRAKDVEVNTYTPKYRDNYNSNGNGINSINSMNTNSANGNMRISEQIKMLNGVRSNSSSGIRKSNMYHTYLEEPDYKNNNTINSNLISVQNNTEPYSTKTYNDIYDTNTRSRLLNTNPNVDSTRSNSLTNAQPILTKNSRSFLKLNDNKLSIKDPNANNLMINSVTNLYPISSTKRVDKNENKNINAIIYENDNEDMEGFNDYPPHNSNKIKPLTSSIDNSRQKILYKGGALENRVQSPSNNVSTNNNSDTSNANSNNNSILSSQSYAYNTRGGNTYNFKNSNNSNSNKNINVYSNLSSSTNLSSDTKVNNQFSRINNNSNNFAYSKSDNNSNVQRPNTITYSSGENNNINSSNNNSFNGGQTSPSNINKNNPLINLEDLMILEEKLFTILENFRAGKPNLRNCLEWWSFYNYSLISGKLESHFGDENCQKIAREACLLELISIITAFEAINDNKNLPTTLNNLKNVVYLIHQNFLIICDYLLIKLTNECSFSNVWVNKLQNLILTKLNKRLKKGENIFVIKQNNENIHIGLKSIFRLINTKISSSINNTNTRGSSSIQSGASNYAAIVYYYKNVNRINYNALNDHFKDKLIKISKCNGVKIPVEYVIESGETFPAIAVPYLKKINHEREFTLVLDLDETLIHFKIDPDTNKGLLHFRPALFEFLEALALLYELVVFTAGTQDYADPILDAIESEKKYFDYRLYRQHAIIIENDFVKDLSKLGRNMSKVIIVDNMPQNFKLQKENGIFIKTFYGEDKHDTALIDLLPILIEIASNNRCDIDVRNELKKYNGYILKKITTNMESN